MGALVLGAIGLFALLVLGRLFVGADPKALAKGVRYIGTALLAAAALGLIALERIPFGLMLASMAWALYTGGRLLPGGWRWMPRRPRSAGGAAGSGGAQTASVRTEWLEIELDPESGAMRGRILKGRYAGQALERLSQAAAVGFYREAGPADPETARLVEAYLDRTYGTGWRHASQGDRARHGRNDGNRRPRSRANGGMSRDEALKILGLMPGAGDEEIRAAHRRLMMQNHPDRGGSGYLAAKINEAKDVLLAG